MFQKVTLFISFIITLSHINRFVPCFTRHSAITDKPRDGFRCTNMVPFDMLVWSVSVLR